MNSNHFIEAEYWEKEIANKDLILENAIKFPYYLMAYFEEKKRVLDVGSGIISRLHSICDKVYLTCCDPLAEFYNYFLYKNKIDTFYPLIKCEGEELSNMFFDFDVVYCSNALDHSRHPAAVFNEMIKVLNPGGYLIIENWHREASQMNFYGLHQHDLYITEEGFLALQSRRGTTLTLEKEVILSNRSDLKLISRPEKVNERQFFTIIWQKAEV